MGMFQKDANDDFLKENENILIDIEKEKLNKIKKVFGKTCADLIRSNFLNIIDGVF